MTSDWRPDSSGVIRAAAVGGFQYSDPDGNPQVLDLAVAGLRDGRLVTLDISDPYAPRLLGTAVNDQGEIISTWVSDISINREAGLAFVTTINSIQVFDLKVPSQPRLLATIAALPDADGKLLPLGSIPTLVEQGGWVYLGSESQGLRVLDLDPHQLKLGPEPLRLDGSVAAKAKRDVNIRADLIPDSSFHAVKAYVVVYEGDSTELWKTELKLLDSHGINTTVVFPAATAKNADQSNRYTFDAKKRYYAGVRLLDAYGSLYEQTPQERFVIPLSWPALFPDYNHDRKIDQSDLDRVAKEDTFYFWINDDDDGGETEGNDIPGPRQGLPSSLDYENPGIDGVRDLIDFFPVVVDAKLLTEHYPPATHRYRLKSTAESVNVVFPELTRGHLGDYLTNTTEARRIAVLPAKQVAASGMFASHLGDLLGQSAQDKFNQLVSSAGTDDNAPVMLVEGRKESTAPLVLEVLDAQNRVVFTSELKLSLAGVEQMFRQKNLILELSKHSEYRLPGHSPVPADAGMADRLKKEDDAVTNKEHFAGFDAESDLNNFVHVHGYNVNGQDARGEQSEAFKRLYWSGSRAKFWGITWYGWESQDPWYLELVPCSGTRSPNYNVNVRHALNSGRLLMNFVNGSVKGNVTVFAHSLGNMVVSKAITDGMTINRYLMVNAAVAEESYTPEAAYADGQAWENSTKISMYHPEWRFPGGGDEKYQPFLWASEWYKQFKGIANEGRSGLTWRDLFAKVREKAYVYYAPTDQAFRPFNYTIEDAATAATIPGTDELKYPDNRTDWPGVEDAMQNLSCINDSKVGTYSWALSELLKGRTFGDSKYGGWGFNESKEDGYYHCDEANVAICGMISPALANALTGSVLKSQPFFFKDPKYDDLYSDTTKTVSSALQEELLANEIPALTFAAGHRGVESVGDNHNIDIRQKFAVGKPWLSDRARYEWRHSDIYVVAYPYLFGLYDEWTKKYREFCNEENMLGSSYHDGFYACSVSNLPGPCSRCCQGYCQSHGRGRCSSQQRTFEHSIFK